MKQPLAIVLSLAFMLVAPAAFADAPDVSTLRPAEYEFVAWSTDGELILLKVRDPNAGLMFQVREADSGEIFKMGRKAAVFPSPYAPNSDEEQKFIKQLINGRKVRADGQRVKFDQAGVAEAVNPKKDEIMLMVGQKKDKLVIMGLREGRATEYETIDVLTDKRGVIAKASQKALVWTDDGKKFCLIYSQDLDSKDTPFKGDFFEVFKFKSYKVKGPKGED